MCARRADHSRPDHPLHAEGVTHTHTHTHTHNSRPDHPHSRSDHTFTGKTSHTHSRSDQAAHHGALGALHTEEVGHGLVVGALVVDGHKHQLALHVVAVT